MSIPNDFPRFGVPGHEKEMASLRSLFWLHYPGSGPKATLWDEWLSAPGLWPAVETSDHSENMRKQWSDVLSARIIDPEGYVATHQHASIAHQQGWPFPFWNQGQGGYGWHFSFKDTIGLPWRPEHLSTQEGWKLSGVKDEGIGEDGWNITLTESKAAATAPKHTIDTFQSPFLQLRWKASGLGNGQPYFEWTTKDRPEFTSDRRFYFEPIDGDKMTYTMVPMYKHPKWKGEITGLRIGFGNQEPGANITIQAFFSQYDTRHNINSQNYIRGCATYFWWTRDLNFLRKNINRMRTALRYVQVEHKAAEKKVVYTTWVGHDGRTGLKHKADGTNELLSGHGIGANYWDLLPCSNLDTYATIHYYDALQYMAKIEHEIADHPEWNVPEGVLKQEPQALLKHAEEVKAEGNKLFWNKETGRFTAGIDADGKMWDYGFTFINLEAVCYGFATPEHAKSIMSWISGDRNVQGDTSQGPDIYHWRFGPRSTTKRNVDYYGWFWAGPENIPWGGQVQDGGAVLGFSYHDLMSRLKTNGADDAWDRLKEVTRWFDEVKAEGGYREYYKDGKRGTTMQGGGTAGGLGLDAEFFESVLVPQVMINGFLGFIPYADGFKINPNLPSDWPELTIDRIRFQDLTLRIKAAKNAIEVLKEGRDDETRFIVPPAGEWKPSLIGTDGKTQPINDVKRRISDGAIEVDWRDAKGLRFDRVK